VEHPSTPHLGRPDAERRPDAQDHDVQLELAHGPSSVIRRGAPRPSPFDGTLLRWAGHPESSLGDERVPGRRVDLEGLADQAASKLP
jgi:hypothetical protein